jgi:hypothetical protein
MAPIDAALKAKFVDSHGGAYEPTSSMDRGKMRELQKIRPAETALGAGAAPAGEMGSLSGRGASVTPVPWGKPNPPENLSGLSATTTPQGAVADAWDNLPTGPDFNAPDPATQDSLATAYGSQPADPLGAIGIAPSAVGAPTPGAGADLASLGYAAANPADAGHSPLPWEMPGSPVSAAPAPHPVTGAPASGIAALPPIQQPGNGTLLQPLPPEDKAMLAPFQGAPPVAAQVPPVTPPAAPSTHPVTGAPAAQAPPTAPVREPGDSNPEPDAWAAVNPKTPPAAPPAAPAPPVAPPAAPLGRGDQVLSDYQQTLSDYHSPGAAKATGAELDRAYAARAAATDPVNAQLDTAQLRSLDIYNPAAAAAMRAQIKGRAGFSPGVNTLKARYGIGDQDNAALARADQQAMQEARVRAGTTRRILKSRPATVAENRTGRVGAR